jgi:hypothetical protein
MQDYFLELAYPFYTRISAFTDVVGGLPNPVLVYQMGKVGSSTVHHTLQEAGTASIHVHHIAEDNWKRRTRMYKENDTTIPAHFHKGRLLRHWINWTDRQMRVVSLVRDPIARHVSEAFEFSHLRGLPTGKPSNALRVLQNELVSDGALEYTYTWFDQEFLPMFGVDIFDHSFNREEGFARITQKNVDILILTLEKLSDCASTTLSEFVSQSLEIKRERVRSGSVYTYVKNNLTLPESTVRRLYDHPWMRHFYTRNDIEQFIERWSLSEV